MSIFLISGPSGVGKTTIVSQLETLIPTLKRIVTYTTRPPRINEQHGIDYFFTDTPFFNKMLANSEFIENSLIYGNQHGTYKSDIEYHIACGLSTIAVLDFEGVCNFKRVYPGSISIMIQPPSLDILQDRLFLRNTDFNKETRLSHASIELSNSKLYDYVVKNHSINETIVFIKSIIEGNQS